MIRTTVASALLAGAVAVALAGCGTGVEPRADAAPPEHPAETLTPLYQQPLPNVTGKTFTSAIVTFPPGAHAMPHRHGEAFVYAYVLDGTVRSQLEGEPAHLYHQGENWAEQPGAHHLSTENASATDPARLLVVFVADDGAQLKVDDPAG